MEKTSARVGEGEKVSVFERQRTKVEDDFEFTILGKNKTCLKKGQISLFCSLSQLSKQCDSRREFLFKVFPLSFPA